MTINFISDLHLNPAEPATAQAFLDFLAGPARDADALWILGDLFEYWAGDDDLGGTFNSDIAEALHGLVSSGVTTKLIVGNRDFLLGPRFTHETGVEIVGEPLYLSLGDKQCVLLHGDALCTDDVAYQQFRQMVRNPAWQAQFLAQSLAVRHKIAADLRAKSEMSKQDKALEIMDVNVDAVAQVFRDSGASMMIHGHTHRPAKHELNVDGATCLRYVLPDWHGNACGIRWNGKTLQTFA
jgi:UDP-2,3-diacylglucosamine hydrolase